MFDILVYVLEHCQQSDLAQDAEGVARRLSEAGFDEPDISTALDWLAGDSTRRIRQVRRLPSSAPAQRIYAPGELARLDPACRGLLLQLEQCGVIDAEARERVLERAFAASVESLTPDQFRLVVLMVLWQYRTPSDRLIAEDLLFGDRERRPS